jgi:alkylation response protein AidB-like acyl-CoA dehydrogenase
MLADEAGFSEDLWREMADLGWMGIVIPEQLDGFGGRLLDLAVLLEEMGYFAVPGPYFSTVVLGGGSILEYGDADQKAEWLPRIARGEARVAMAVSEFDRRFSAPSFGTRAVEEGTGYRISGKKFFVDSAHVANLVVCAADVAGATTLFLVDRAAEGMDVALLKTTDGSRLCEVNFDNVFVPATHVLGDVGDGGRQLGVLMRRAALSSCARMVGGMRRVLEMTIDYVKIREQFGQPVGAFQAVQHHCADMATDIEVSRLMTYEAVWRMDQGLDWEGPASMAKAWVGEAYGRVMLGAHQCIGGVGFMLEHDLPLYSRPATGLELLFGDSDFHRECVASSIGL